MQVPVPFSPDQASSYAGRVDSLYAFLCVLTFLVGGLISLVIIYFAVKYRRRSEYHRLRILSTTGAAGVDRICHGTAASNIGGGRFYELTNKKPAARVRGSRLSNSHSS